MCSRYKLLPDRKELGRLLDLAWTPELLQEREVRPTDLGIVVRRIEKQLLVSQMSWGFFPRETAPTPSKATRLINARSESIHEKPTFRDSFRKRRCVVPASMYFEWRDEDLAEDPGQTSLFDSDLGLQLPRKQGKKRFQFRVVDTPVFAFAALWEPNSLGLETFTVLTTDANEAAARVHPRMPCILSTEGIEAWLDPKIQSYDTLAPFLLPIESGRMSIEVG